MASVTSLCREMARRGHEVCLLTGMGPLHPDVRRLAGSVRVRIASLGPYSLAHWSPAFAGACREEARWADVVHDHGVWLHTNWSSAAAAWGAGRPLVRSPRGMLSPWALSRSGLRKRVLWTLIEERHFRRASLVHATSELESQELRALELAGPTAVIPNGIDTDDEYSLARVRAARLADGSDRACRRFLFLSRIHAKKGLDLLQQAWEGFPSTAGAELVIAGDGEPAAVESLERWVATQAGPPARYVGLVHGEEKLRLLASGWALVLPSRSENYGMAVAESLAAGTPAITTTATPWSELQARGCGWTVGPNAEALAAAVRQALGIDDNAHEVMRENARRYVEQEHSLRAVGARFEAAYADLVSAHPVGPG